MRLSSALYGLSALLAFGCNNAVPKAAVPPSTQTVASGDERAQIAFPRGRDAGFFPDGWGGVSTAPGDAIPVTPADPMWGNPTAPVTIVEFADFQCPYCAKAVGTMAELRKMYGPDKLRIVWKNYPLPKHEGARPAADLGAGIFALGGSEAFFAYEESLYAGYMSSGEDTDFMAIAVSSAATAAEHSQGRISGPSLMEAARGAGAAKVDADLALADKVGVSGTPAFFVNGVLVSGAQPAESFKPIIDGELRLAEASIAAGTPPLNVYAARLADNVKAGRSQKEGKSRHSATGDNTVWRVPVTGSPVRGNINAPVTLVEFGDFECHYCKKANATVEELRAKYGDKLRVVFKQNPLPFHKHAAPAAELSLEIWKKKGNDAFWKAHDALFAADASQMDEESLEAIAKTAGLDPKATSRAMAANKHADIIEADQDLAGDIGAEGTPCFFINGRKLMGAQPMDQFEKVIDEQLVVAKAKIASGTSPAKVYDALIKDAKSAPPPETKVAPAVSKANPTRGAAGAKVTVQIFSDFQCPFCKQVEPTLADLEKAFPGKLRIVWRNHPLPMHENADAAAVAAMEARKQKGDKGFWKMHDLLFADQDALDRKGLEQKAQTLGLDLAGFRAALDGNSHRAELDADSKIAEDLGINGTPGILINDYFISGAESLSTFKRVVRLAMQPKK